MYVIWTEEIFLKKVRNSLTRGSIISFWFLPCSILSINQWCKKKRSNTIPYQNLVTDRLEVMTIDLMQFSKAQLRQHVTYLNSNNNGRHRGRLHTKESLVSWQLIYKVCEYYLSSLCSPFLYNSGENNCVQTPSIGLLGI